MDANRFDALVKALGLSAARRGIVAGLFGGGMASLLATLESEARRHPGRRSHRDADLSADKKHKKKCKKCGPCKKCKKGKCKPKLNGTPCSGGSCQSGACKPGDEAPPCTEDSCPLPPECSQQDFDDCGNALIEALQADAEPCRPLCEGGDSPACQACVEPFVRDRLLDIEACTVESCSSSARAAAARHRADTTAGQAVARDWWVRQCDKPCCFRELQACKEDLAETYALCLIAAVVTCFTPAAPVCASAIAGCLYFAMYSITKCNVRYGCLEFDACKGDNTCCPQGQTACGEECCGVAAQCCEGGGCCNSDDVCCRTTGGEHYCCSGEDELTCKLSGGPTCVKA